MSAMTGDGVGPNADGGGGNGPCGRPQASILVSIFLYVLQTSFTGDA